MSVFEKLFAFGKWRFCFLLFRENDIFWIFRAFSKGMIFIEKFFKCQILNWKKNTTRQN